MKTRRCIYYESGDCGNIPGLACDRTEEDERKCYGFYNRIPALSIEQNPAKYDGITG